MVHRAPSFLFLIKLKHRKFHDPGKVHLFRVVEFQFRSKPFSQSIQGLTGGFPTISHEQQNVTRLSLHPLAQAVVAYASHRFDEIPVAQDVQTVPGEGLAATISGKQVVIGHEELLAGRGLELQHRRRHPGRRH